METKKFWELLGSNTDKPRVLVYTNIVNGIAVCDQDLGDEDAMRENNEF